MNYHEVHKTLSFTTGVHNSRGLLGGEQAAQLEVSDRWASKPSLPSVWKNCLPQKWSVVPIRLGTTALKACYALKLQLENNILKLVKLAFILFFPFFQYI